MPVKKDGIMVILSSPSGAGKTTLVKLLSQKKILISLYLIPLENPELMKLKIKIIILLMMTNFRNS